MHHAKEITLLLDAVRDGDRQAVDTLFERVYDQLRALSSAQRSRWTGDYTLDTTALVHEAYLKLVDQKESNWQDRAHFFAVASRAMRHILVNYAERRMAQKRGGNVETIPLDQANPVAPQAAEPLLALNDALNRLEEVDPRQCRVIECRFFSGLAIHETAETLGVSPATVKRDWAMAIAWLRREVSADLSLTRPPEVMS